MAGQTIILSERLVCDGYNVRCRLPDGTEHTLHFAYRKPEDVQTAVEAWVTAREEAVEQYEVEGE